MGLLTVVVWRWWLKYWGGAKFAQPRDEACLGLPSSLGEGLGMTVSVVRVSLPNGAMALVRAVDLDRQAAEKVA